MKNHQLYNLIIKHLKLSDNQAQIKIFKDNDWKWITITFNHKNLQNRDLEDFKELNPTLVKKGKKYFLHIPFEGNIKLNRCGFRFN